MSRAPHSAFVDMTDRRVRNVTVQRRAANQKGVAAWFVRCPDGHEFVVIGIALRDAEKHHRDVQCPDCPDLQRKGRRADMARRRVSPDDVYVPSGGARAGASCLWCSQSGHTRRTCPEYAKARRGSSRPRFCGTCSGLAHRRERPRCPECGGAYEPEKRVTIDDVMAQPFHNRREVA